MLVLLLLAYFRIIAEADSLTHSCSRGVPKVSVVSGHLGGEASPLLQDPTPAWSQLRFSVFVGVPPPHLCTCLFCP